MVGDMAERSSGSNATGDPVVRDADGARSLDFDDGTVQSRMLDAEPTRLVLEYTRLMMGFLLLHPAPTRIAMIGLGGGSLAKYCRATLPAADFTAVEISAAVVALRDRFALPPDGPRFRILCADGAAFVRRDDRLYDVLLVDGFDRGGQPADLCSAAFYDACRARLAGGGVLVVNLHTDEPDCDACVARIGQAFADRTVAIRADQSANLVVFAGTEAPFPPPFETIVAHLRALAPAHPVALDSVARKIVAYRAPRTSRRRGR
jgi:spermidine synthase